MCKYFDSNMNEVERNHGEGKIAPCSGEIENVVYGGGKQAKQANSTYRRWQAIFLVVEHTLMATCDVSKRTANEAVSA